MRILSMALAGMLVLASAPAAIAHGGGGGGGGGGHSHGGGGHGYVFIPIYVPTGLVAPPPAQVGNYSAIKKIAIISALGDNLTLKEEYFLGSKSAQINISDWRIDELATNAIARHLSSKFEIESVAFDRNSIARLPNGPLDNTRSDVQQILRAIPKGDLDAFVVVRPDLETQAPGLQGLALVSNWQPSPVIWANYEIDLIDARSFVTLAKAYSRIRATAGHYPESFAAATGSATLSLGDTLSLNSTQQEILHRQLSKLVTDSLSQTLLALGLIPDPASAEGRHLVQIPPNKDIFRNKKTVAVISTLGDGLSFFDVSSDANTQTMAYEPAWQINMHAETTLRGLLAKRFTIVDAPTKNAAISIESGSGSKSSAPARATGLPQSTSTDIYVLLVATKLPVANGAEASGLGVWHSTPPGRTRTAVFANYSIVVVDAHSLNVISSQQAIASPDRESEAPFQTVALWVWPKYPNTLAWDQSLKIRTTAFDVLDNSLNETCMSIGLLGVQPASMLDASTQ